MFAGIYDELVDCGENRKFYQFLKENSNEKMVKFEEVEFDHLSFLLAKDMSYFKKVQTIIEEYNPIPNQIKEQEKQRQKL